MTTGLVCFAFCLLPAAGAWLGLLPKAALGGLVACAVLPLLQPSEVLMPIALSRDEETASAIKCALRAAAVGWATVAATLYCAPRLELGLVAGLCVHVAVQRLIPESVEEPCPIPEETCPSFYCDVNWESGGDEDGQKSLAAN